MHPHAVSRILVPIDFSPCSRAALDYAAQLAEQTRARVEVLHVDEPSGFALPDALTPGRESRSGAARDALSREVDAFLGEQRPRVGAVRVQPGRAADVISDVAREGFDLVVMGTHGRSGLSRLVVGSVAESVMRQAPVPVLTLRLPKRETRERIPL